MRSCSTAFLPFLDHLITEFESRFSELSSAAVQGLLLLPGNLNNLNDEKEAEIRSRFAADLPEPNTFQEELKRWRKKWEIQALANVSLPSNINGAFEEANTLSFPNIQRVLTILLEAPVTTATVERSNSALGYINTKRRSTMAQQRLNDLILLFDHKDIPLDVDAVIDRFARMKPRCMALTNALTTTDAV